ncbi:hypothetical protein H4R99_002989 [Coemansia sp. RSA 1722]|nr:hypothetical protein IWW45_007922 [Coemansia sp. RSA 485]KAJ2601520.1 hypothetical protein H4R99_002989 [Coemansia sp. RSA 1722]
MSTDKTLADNNDIEQKIDLDTDNPIPHGLSDTAETLGASVQAMQQVLLGNMRQAAQMTLSMNQMMEELVKRAIHVSVICQPSTQTGTCNLLLRVDNRSPIPLIQLTTKLWFTRHGQERETGGLTVTCVDDDVDLEKSLLGGSVKNSMVLLDEAALDEQPFVTGTYRNTLASGLVSESLVAVETEWPVQIAGKIAVEFVSPGTGNTLSVSHRFGLQVRQLMPCWFEQECSSVAANPESLSIGINIEKARSIFEVPPTRGICVGSVFKMGSDSEYLALRIDSISDDCKTASCAWLSSSDNTRLNALIPVLTEEFSSIG